MKIFGGGQDYDTGWLSLTKLHVTVYSDAMGNRKKPVWDAEQIRSLRGHLKLTQDGLAEELNVRQQTVSEWETGQYQPRGASERVLTIIAERADFQYGEQDD